jgi:hypothetical protein
MKAVAETLGVARSDLLERRAGLARQRGRYRKDEVTALPPLIRAIVDERPTYGHRRGWALLNRQMRAVGEPEINRKRLLRIMQV